MSDASEKQEEMELEFHTDMPVGEILRRTRRHYGQSLDQIEQVLRIRAQQLEALENGEIHKLPGRVYAIGFVRSYSEYLGLDGDKMVHLFKEQSVGKQKKPELSFPVPASESKIPNLTIIIVSVAGVLLLVGFISFLMFPEAPQNGIPSVPDTLTKSQLNEAPALVGEAGPVEAVTQQAPQTDANGITTVKNRIQLEIIDSSWVEIKNKDGAPILRQVLKPGDIYMVPNEPGLTLATGNAGGIRVKVDGIEVAPIGAPAAVKRNVKLDPDALLKTAPAGSVPTSDNRANPPPAAPVQPALSVTPASALAADTIPAPEPVAAVQSATPATTTVVPEPAMPSSETEVAVEPEPQEEEVTVVRPEPAKKKTAPSKPSAPSPRDNVMINQ